MLDSNGLDDTHLLFVLAPRYEVETFVVEGFMSIDQMFLLRKVKISSNIHSNSNSLVKRFLNISQIVRGFKAN